PRPVGPSRDVRRTGGMGLAVARLVVGLLADRPGRRADAPLRRRARSPAPAREPLAGRGATRVACRRDHSDLRLFPRRADARARPRRLPGPLHGPAGELPARASAGLRECTGDLRGDGDPAGARVCSARPHRPDPGARLGRSRRPRPDALLHVRPRPLARACVAVLAAGLVKVGGPGAAVRRAYHAFNAPAPLVKTNASQRLFSLSGSNRSEYWRVAWREYEDHPWLGGGAGSYQRFWLRHRRNGLPVLDAHSLYLETLAELGPLGLLLLLAALALPLGAA